MYNEYALVKKSTLSGTADAIREKTGSNELIDPAEFESRIRGISGGGSTLEGGFTVNFHDTEGDLIEVHSALLGKSVGAPLSYFPISWRDSDDAIKQFPMTINEVCETDIFASNYSYNLANCNSCPTGTSYGVTIEAYFDEGGYMRYISTTGVNNDEYMDIWYDIGTAPDLEAGVEYVLTGCPSGGGSVISNATESWGLQLYSDNGADKSDFGDGVVFTPSKVYTNVKIRICVGTKTAGVNGAKWYPMLRRSDTGENVYLPYAGI